MAVRPLLVALAAMGAMATLTSLAACSGSTATPAAKAPTTAPTTTAPPKVYVAVGASETVGVGADDPGTQAWPTVFARTALPAGSTYVNHGISGATVQQALVEEVPSAVAASPDLATVWLNVNDLIRLVSPADYEARLGDLVHQLRRGGATKVLVANTPALDRLPILLACLPNPPPSAIRCPVPVTLPSVTLIDRQVDAYNQAIARVAQREGAVVVDLHAAGLLARVDGTEASLVGRDGFHPSTAGHAAVAAVFARALAAGGGP